MANCKKYNKSEFTSLTNKINLSLLETEITAASLSNELEGMSIWRGEVADICFKNDLLNADITKLDTVVSNHTGDAGEKDGYYHKYADDEGQSSTTSGSYITKVEFATNKLTTENYYIVHYYCEIKQSRRSGQIIVDVSYNGESFATPAIEPQDTKNWYPLSGFKKIKIKDGAKVEMKYKRLYSGTAYIRRARILITETTG